MLPWPVSLQQVTSPGGTSSLGEQRLALRRVALAGALDEFACSLHELMDLYRFEGRVLLDARRVDELQRELAALQETGGAAGQEV
jgi:hypothetical protein